MGAGTAKVMFAFPPPSLALKRQLLGTTQSEAAPSQIIERESGGQYLE